MNECNNTELQGSSLLTIPAIEDSNREFFQAITDLNPSPERVQRAIAGDIDMNGINRMAREHYHVSIITLVEYFRSVGIFGLFLDKAEMQFGRGSRELFAFLNEASGGQVRAPLADRVWRIDCHLPVASLEKFIDFITKNFPPSTREYEEFFLADMNNGAHHQTIIEFLNQHQSEKKNHRNVKEIVMKAYGAILSSAQRLELACEKGVDILSADIGATGLIYAVVSQDIVAVEKILQTAQDRYGEHSQEYRNFILARDFNNRSAIDLLDIWICVLEVDQASSHMISNMGGRSPASFYGVEQELQAVKSIKTSLEKVEKNPPPVGQAKKGMNAKKLDR